jgi:hypothetical protein
MTVRTLVWDGIVYVEFLPGTGSWGVAIDGDDRLPAGAERVAANLIAWRTPAGDGDFELRLTRDGQSFRFRIDTVGGVIEPLDQRHAALGFPDLPDLFPDTR